MTSVEVHLHVWLTFRQKLTDLDWSVTRQFVPTCRYSTGNQALAFHKPVQHLWKPKNFHLVGDKFCGKRL